MNHFIRIENLKEVNSAEATFGDIHFFGNTLIFPFINLYINNNHNSNIFFKALNNKYISYSILVFENFSGITLDYDLSRSMHSENRKCYGGTYFRDNENYEYWIEYKKGILFLPNVIKSSPKEFKITVEYISFFENQNSIN